MGDTPEALLVDGVWKLIPDASDTAWIERVAELPRTEEPLGAHCELVRQMLAAGVTKGQLARFAKTAGYETAFSILYLLGDPYGAVSEASRDLADAS